MVLILFRVSASPFNYIFFMRKHELLYRSYEMRRLDYESAHLRQDEGVDGQRWTGYTCCQLPALTQVRSARLGVSDAHSSEAHANIWLPYYNNSHDEHLELNISSGDWMHITVQ